MEAMRNIPSAMLMAGLVGAEVVDTGPREPHVTLKERRYKKARRRKQHAAARRRQQRQSRRRNRQ